ncbi:hydroxyacyl-thioester dehydratase type 2, mitochondrial-like [Rhodnius prolixus]|uniref:hydroxyacyl-thioester dehydratase type 2, mitochondrial-like n=1 Tax=Rhodnius prolixus TaxID=13249 RepID=UPI003D18F9CB
MYRQILGTNILTTRLFSTQLTRQNSENKVVIERTVSTEDVEKFAELTGDNNKVHYGENGIVHGTFLNGLVSSVIGTKLPGHGTLVLSQNITYPNPCPIGSNLIITVEVKSWRKIITCFYDIRNKQDNSIVLQGDAKLIMKKS